jgi:hypothetical protein
VIACSPTKRPLGSKTGPIEVDAAGDAGDHGARPASKKQKAAHPAAEEKEKHDPASEKRDKDRKRKATMSDPAKVMLKHAKENLLSYASLLSRFQGMCEMIEKDLDGYAWAAEDADFKELTRVVESPKAAVAVGPNLSLAVRLADISKVKQQLDGEQYAHVLVGLSGMKTNLQSGLNLLAALEEMHQLKVRRRLGIAAEHKAKARRSRAA